MRFTSRILTLVTLLVVVVLSACGGTGQPATAPTPTPQWQELKPANAGYAILMPALAQGEAETRDTRFGQLTLNKQAAEFDRMIFGVAYSSLPDDLFAAYSVEQILEAMQDAVLRYYRGRLLSSKSIKLGDYPGVEMTVEVPDDKRTPGGGVWRTRFYLVDHVVYEIDHLGSKRQSISPDIRKFMDSFQLTGETPAMTPAPIEAGEWQEFQPTEGHFRILLPREPLKEFVPLGGDFGPLELNWFTTQLGPQEYGVGYVDLPENKLKLYDTSALLNAMNRSAAKTFNGRILSSKAITLDQYPGHEIVLEGTSPDSGAEKVVVRARIYLVDHRLYEVVQAAPKSQSQLPDVQQFFDSFTLLDQ